MSAKTLFLALLLILPILACAGGDNTSGGSSGSGTTSRVGGDDEVLKLLPKDVTRIQVAAADAITGGSVPETMTDLFEGTWKNYSLGGEDEIVTVDDVGKVVWAISPEGGIVMLGGGRIDFAAIGQWLADEETNIGKTSYQGQEMWGNDSVAMVVMQGDGYLVFGDTDAVKELLKVKARGSGSLADDSENSLKKAYEDAASGWYVSASSNCDELFPDLRSCEAYTITGSRGDEDYLVNVTWRFTFRSEQRAESQSLDIEDWIEDRNYEWDIDEVKADGVSVEAKMSGDEEDFNTRWIGTDNIYTPPVLPTAVPDPESRSSTQATEPPEPTATLSPSAVSVATPAPTEAPLASQEGLRIAGPCTSDILKEGIFTGVWRDGCPLDVSDWSKGFAHYYQLRIADTSLVVIELVAHASDAATGLALLQGEVGNESVLAFNSDIGFARMQVQLAPGEYTIEAKATRQVVGNPYFDLYFDLLDTAAAPAPTAAPGEPATLEEYAAMVAGGAGAVYVGDLTQLAGPAPYHDDKLGDDDGMVPLEALERHRWIYESDYYRSLLDRANLNNPSPLTSSGERIDIQLACINRALPPCLLLEGFLAPFLEAGTNSQLTLEVSSFPELGIAGPDTLVQLRYGTHLSAATVYGGYVSGQLPQFGIQNLWGIYSSPEQAFEASQAIINDIDGLVLAETGGVIMNHSWHAGDDQFMFCRERIDTPDDFEGRKIRSFSSAMSDWLNGMGADAQYVDFAELYIVLERGILDCGVSTADAAHRQRLYEVADYIIGPLPSFPFSPNVINAGVWRSIPHDLQQILIEDAAMQELEALRLAAVQNEVGLQRNIDAGMEFIPFSDEMNRRSLEAAMNSVIPNWVDRVGGPDALIVTDTFNNKVGPIVGLRIQPNGEVVRTN